MTRLLVCGSREWTDRDLIFAVLDAHLGTHPDLVVIEGEAPGADRCAAQWASERGLDQVGRLIRVPAHWRHNSRCSQNCTEVQGKMAGPIRNRKMLKHGPNRVEAFHENLVQSAGTLDMAYRALTEGVPVYWWDTEGKVRPLGHKEVGDWKRAREERKRRQKGLDTRPRML